MIVLLGGEAGLRCGEIMALEWSDVNLVKGQLCVERSDWKGHVTSPKGGRLRYVPLTRRLWAALGNHRHLRGARVLCEADGRPLTQKVVQGLVRRAARKAGLKHPSVDTSNPAIDRQFKTGHFCRSTETHAVLLRQRLSAQVGVD
ncbi:MAG: tyrosine-type recombinase/integrase, partial [Vicinamibacterales bacterium]